MPAGATTHSKSEWGWCRSGIGLPADRMTGKPTAAVDCPSPHSGLVPYPPAEVGHGNAEVVLEHASSAVQCDLRLGIAFYEGAIHTESPDGISAPARDALARSQVVGQPVQYA